MDVSFALGALPCFYFFHWPFFLLSIKGREGSSKPLSKKSHMCDYQFLIVNIFSICVCLVPIPGSLAQSVSCLSIPLVCRLYFYLSLVRKPFKAI